MKRKREQQSQIILQPPEIVNRLHVCIPPRRVHPLQPKQVEHLFLGLKIERLRVVSTCSKHNQTVSNQSLQRRRANGLTSPNYQTSCHWDKTRVSEKQIFISSEGADHLSLTHCRRSRWNMMLPLQPMTAHQYTSGRAKMRSNRRRRPCPLCSLKNGDVLGRMNTVRDFSSESQWVVRSGLWPWKLDRSGLWLWVNCRLFRTEEQLTHDVCNHAYDAPWHKHTDI